MSDFSLEFCRSLDEVKLVAGGGPTTRKENPNEWPVQEWSGAQGQNVRAWVKGG